MLSLDFGVSGRVLVLDKICVTADETSFPMNGFTRMARWDHLKLK